jgi:hypothetical protein
MACEHGYVRGIPGPCTCSADCGCRGDGGDCAPIERPFYADDLLGDDDSLGAQTHGRVIGGWICTCGFTFAVRAHAVGIIEVAPERAARIADMISKGHKLDDADAALFAHVQNGSGRRTPGGVSCGGRP